MCVHAEVDEPRIDWLMLTTNYHFPLVLMTLFSSRHAVIFLSQKELVGYKGHKAPTRLYGKQRQCAERRQRILKRTFKYAKKGKTFRLIHDSGEYIYQTRLKLTFITNMSLTLIFNRGHAPFHRDSKQKI